MNAHYSIELPHAFVIGDDELKKIARLLADRIGNLEICADCADDVSRTFHSVNELVAYENPKPKEIVRIRLNSCSDDCSKNAAIDLSGSRWRGISLDFRARDDVVTHLRTDILDIIVGIRPWYSVMHRIDFVFIGFLAYSILWFGLIVVVAFKWIHVEEDYDSSHSAFAQLVVFGGIALLVAIGILLNRFRDRVFPRAVFLIGQGRARFKHLERIQWGFIIAFVASFAAGIVLALLQTIAA